DDAVGQPQRVRPRDPALVERRDVDKRGRLADRVVLDVVGVGVDRRGPVARPLAPLLLAVQRRGAWMEGAADAHRASIAAPLTSVGPRRARVATASERCPCPSATTRSSSAAATTA